MSQNDSDDDAEPTIVPSLANIQAFSYKGHVPESQAKAAAMRDLGYENKDVASALGVSTDAASSYYSKFNTEVGNAPSFVLSTFGGPKSIRGWQIIQDDEEATEHWYAVKPIREPQDLKDANEYPPNGEFVLVKVRGTPTSFDAETTEYESLDAMADDIYRNVEFDDQQVAQEVRGVLTEAGLPEDALPDVREKVPAADASSFD